MATPHISADPGAFAPSVLMPGDPLRARFIAQQFLSEATLITSVRGNEGYTGTWNGAPVSVLASGMGMPSMALYSTELFRFYGVEQIVRVGTCGALQPDFSLGDIIVADRAETDSAIPAVFGYGPGELTADPTLLRAALAAASEQGQLARRGAVFSSDLFYSPDTNALGFVIETGALAIEMEAAGLYAVARHEGKQALTVLTVSDLVATGEAMSSDERQRGVESMVQVALAATSAI